MKLLRDGRAKLVGLILNGSELETIQPILKRTRRYQVASIKKEYGGGYELRGVTDDIYETIINFLSME